MVTRRWRGLPLDPPSIEARRLDTLLCTIPGEEDPASAPCMLFRRILNSMGYTGLCKGGVFEFGELPRGGEANEFRFVPLGDRGDTMKGAAKGDRLGAKRPMKLV